MALNLKFIASRVWYTPDILDNRESDAPFRVFLEPLSGAQHEALVLAGSFGTEETRSRAVTELRDRFIAEKVITVENLVLTDETGTAFEPANGAQLLDYAKRCDAEIMATLLWDIYAAICNRSALEAGLAKKSLSALPAADTISSASGDAASAGGTS